MRILVNGKEINGDIIKETSEYWLIKFKGGKCLRVGKNRSGLGHKIVQVKK